MTAAHLKTFIPGNEDSRQAQLCPQMQGVDLEDWPRGF